MTVDGEGAARSPHAPRRPSRSFVRGRLVEVRPSLDGVLAAAMAIGALIVVKFAVALVLLLGNAVDYNPAFYSNGFLASPVGLFLGSVVLYPFPFYVAAFAALALVFPIVRSATLPIVLARSVAAGATATVVLALVGIATGVVMATSTGNWISVVLYVVFIPLAAGIQLTAVLAGASALAWLWAVRAEPVATDKDPTETDAEPADAAPAPEAEPEAVAQPDVSAPVSLPDSIFAPPDDLPPR